MSQHGEHAHQHGSTSKKGFHRDWRFWTAVVFMLAAMAMYVLSMDEAVEPGLDAGPEFPAAAE